VWTPEALILSKSLANVPLVTVIAAIRREVDTVEGPGELGRREGLTLSAVPLLRGALLGEVAGHAAQGTRGEGGTTATLFHLTELIGPVQ